MGIILGHYGSARPVRKRFIIAFNIDEVNDFEKWYETVVYSHDGDWDSNKCKK